MLLRWAVLGVSFYLTVLMLWLGLMVLLAGNRRSAAAWLTGGGLLLGALFFTSHTAILGRGLSDTGLGMNFWWSVSWAPAVVAPLAWYAAMLWQAGFDLRRPHRQRAGLAAATLLGLAVLLLVFFANPLPTYHAVAGVAPLPVISLGGIPLLIPVYVLYTLLCYLLPLDLLRLPAGPPAKARPWLVGASLAMLLATGGLAATALWALTPAAAPGLADPAVEASVLRLDLLVSTLVAAAVTLLGRAVVGFEAFTGRALPRGRLLLQWRSAVLLAAGFGAAAGGSLALGLRPIYSLMLAVALMTAFYALYAWRSIVERDVFMQRLRPFVAGQHLVARLTGPEPAGRAAEEARALFNSLCVEVLGVARAALVPSGDLAGLAGPPLVYPPGAQFDLPAQRDEAPTGETRVLEAGAPGWAWAVPLSSGHASGGVLWLGERAGGAPFSEEEIDIARAAGERLLDALAGAELARLSIELLSQRLAEARVLEGRGRRMLHDEVLPELHAAVLDLSSRAGPDPATAVEVLSRAHRRISDLLRASNPSVPARLAQAGPLAALREWAENDLSVETRALTWQIDPAAEATARALPQVQSETFYFAARELLRNAARHARGGAVRASLIEEAGALVFSLRDDGPRETGEGAGGAGSGLRIHSAMLAAVGGALEMDALPEGGTHAVIRLAPRR